jgi:hypothetical protein
VKHQVALKKQQSERQLARLSLAAGKSYIGALMRGPLGVRHPLNISKKVEAAKKGKAVLKQTKGLSEAQLQLQVE